MQSDAIKAIGYVISIAVITLLACSREFSASAQVHLAYFLNVGVYVVTALLIIKRLIRYGWSLQGLLFLGTAVSLGTSYDLWNRPSDVLTDGRWIVGALSFSIFSVFALLFLCTRYAAVLRGFKFVHWVLSAAIFVALVKLQYNFMLKPLWFDRVSHLPEEAVAVYGAYRVLFAGIVSLSLPLGMLTVTGCDLLIMQAWTVLFTSAFGWVHRLVSGNTHISTWTWQIWTCCGLAMLCAVLIQPSDRQLFSCDVSQMKGWRSVRAMLATAILVANVLVVLALEAFQVVKFENGQVFGSTIASILGAWVLANLVGFYVSHRLENVRFLMEFSCSHGRNIGTNDFLPLEELQDWLVCYERVLQEKQVLARAEHSRDREVALGQLAAQVAHDIRSPLAALNMLVPDLNACSESTRMLAREAIQRIQDIANDLLAKNRGSSLREESDAIESVFLNALVAQIATEKRLQYRSLRDVTIQTEDLGCTGVLFAQIDSGNLKRCLSNLINNAVESTRGRQGGAVTVGISCAANKALIQIQDNGCGIPDAVLSRLGQRGTTLGKSGGNGLGVYQARQAVEAAGGAIEYSSKVGLGTCVSVSLPLCSAPEWFVESVDIQQQARVIILDDDRTIHGVWDRRLSEHASVQVFHASTAKEFAECVGENRLDNDTFLVDYELVGENCNGLNVIERHGLQGRAILVTSRYNEPKVLESCRALKVKVLPKAAAAFIPVRNQSAAS